MAYNSLYQPDPKEYESLKKFVYNNRIAKIEQKIQARHSMPAYSSYSYWDRNEYIDYHLQHEHVKVFTLEIDERQLVNIAGKVNELDELMQDPETAKLLTEARFIYRLKHGTAF